MTGRLARNRRALLASALALGLLAALGARGGQAQEAAPGTAPLRQEVTLGPVRLTLEADRATMPIDGELRLSLLVEAPAGTVVTLPEVGDKLGAFVVASQTAQALDRTPSGLGQWRHDYVLEAEDVGALAVPPLKVAFRAADAGQPRELTTEPVAITVTSVLPADVDFTEYKDIAPPVELPPAGLAWLVWPLALLTLGLAGLALLLWRRRRRAAAAAPEAGPAHLLALAELERLGRRLPADRSGAEDFYVRLADILRRYVALRFGLDAPTRTTEELLAAAESTGGPIAARRHQVAQVLGQCDLVKFARRQPTPAAAPANLSQARDFVEETGDQRPSRGPRRRETTEGGTG